MDADESFTSDATAVACLRSQAAAVQNIKNLILIVLDLEVSNYSKWRCYVLLTLGSLQEHVLSNVAQPHDLAWSS